MNLLPCLAVATIALGATVDGVAGPEHLIKQRAKDVANQNNERQGVAPAQPSAPPPAQPAVTPQTAPPSGPALSTQAAAIRDALGGLPKEGSPTADQLKPLQQSLGAVSGAKAKPAEPVLSKLTTDLSNAVSGEDLKSATEGKLAAQLEAILKGTVTGKDMESATAAVHDLLREAGAGRVEAMVVANDLKGIIVEQQRTTAK